MCDPVTAAIVAGVATVASTTASVVGQAQAAKVQARAVNNQLAVAREETRAAATAETFDAMRAARREQASIRTAAGQAGLSLASGSVEALLLDSAMQEELRRDRIDANMESRHRSQVAEAESMMSQIQKPTVLGAGIQIAGAAAQAFSGVSRAKIATRGPSSG